MRPIVLLVEDHSETRALYALSLSLEGFTVVEAPDGVAAMAWLQNGVPYAIVTDLAMAGVNGIELCRCIRTRPSGREVAILAVTGESNRQARLDVEAAELCAMFDKPLSPDALGHAVSSASVPRCAPPLSSLAKWRIGFASPGFDRRWSEMPRLCGHGTTGDGAGVHL